MEFPREILDSLIAFNNKFQLINKTNFLRHFQSQGLELHQTIYPQLKSGTISLNEPSEENIDAFILHFRQFHLVKDVISIKNLTNIIDQIPNEFNEQKEKIKSYLKEFKNSLEQEPPIKLNITINKKKFNLKYRKDFIKTMMYGGKFHTSKDSKERLYYEYFHKNSKQGFKPILKRMFRFNVYSIILDEINILGFIAFEINKILLGLITKFKKEAEEYHNTSKYEQSIKYYVNAIYITNQLEYRREEAQLLEKVLLIYEKLNNTEEVSKIQNQIQEIRSSLEEFPVDFYKDPFYQNYFQMPSEFATLFNDALPDIGLSDKPIIVIPVERIYDITKLEKHLNMKYFTYEIELDKLKISFSLAILRNNKGTIYLDKTEQINLNQKFGLTFVYPDLSCFIILTNDPKTALLNYIHIRGGCSLDPLMHMYVNKLVEFIIALSKIELKISTSRPYFEKKEDVFNVRIDIDFLSKYNASILMIFRRIIEISYFPRLIQKVDLSYEIMLLQNSIENDLDKPLKGQSLLSLGVSIYLYSALTNDSTYLERKPKLNSLFQILSLIKGQDIKNEFYHSLLEYLDRKFFFFQQKRRNNKTQREKGFKFRRKKQ